MSYDQNVGFSHNLTHCKSISLISEYGDNIYGDNSDKDTELGKLQPMMKFNLHIYMLVLHCFI